MLAAVSFSDAWEVAVADSSPVRGDGVVDITVGGTPYVANRIALESQITNGEQPDMLTLSTDEIPSLTLKDNQQPPPCIDFADGDPGTEIGVGSSLTSGGVLISAEPFTDTFGIPFFDGTLSVVSTTVTGGVAPELHMSAINANFDIAGRFPTGANFFAYDQGGTFNFVINGDFFNGENLEDLDGLTLGGVYIRVPFGGGENMVTEVQMIGAVNELIIGGQELTIDDLCPFTWRGDLGDAPASENQAGMPMTAYTGVQANFPTVYTSTNNTVNGPLHLDAALLRLGSASTAEVEADRGYDADPSNNIDTLNDIPNLDLEDDGVHFPSTVEHCVPVTVEFDVTTPATSLQEPYFNLWLDWDRSGAWDESYQCEPGIQGDEWAVQNMTVTLNSPGTHTFVSDVFYVPEQYQHGLEVWARASISDQPASHRDGRGPVFGYQVGETEDYLVSFDPPEPVCEPYSINMLAGNMDNFAPPTEPMSPSLGIEAIWQKHYPNAALSHNFDETAFDRSGGHTFTGIGAVSAENYITNAQLQTSIRTNLPWPGIYNDWLFLGHLTDTGDWIPGAIRWQNNISNTYSFPNVTPPVQFGAAYTLTLDLSNIESSIGPAFVDLRSGIEQYGFLDFIYSDDISIDYLKLSLEYQCHEEPQSSDLGDAPDSTFNHFNADNTAYSDTGTLGRFPTVFADTPSGEPVGPIHRDLSELWLGALVSAEAEADIGPDDDGINNLYIDGNDSADLDQFDDGVDLNTLHLPDCGMTTFDYSVYNEDASEPSYHVNVWIDFNTDGDWEDTWECLDENEEVITVYEHAVSTSIAFTGFGLHHFTTPQFASVILDNSNDERPEALWMRITLSETEPPANPNTDRPDGRGPGNGYGFGETEDYFVAVPDPEGCQTNEGTITGVVQDKNTAAPLANIQVLLHEYDGVVWTPTGHSALTDASGMYTITAPANVYHLYLSDPFGLYQAQWHNEKLDAFSADDVFVDPCLTTTLDHVMEPDEAEPDPIKILDGDGEIVRDPDTGAYTINVFRTPNGDVSDFVICVTLTCDDGSTPSNVRIVVDGTVYPMTPGTDPDTWVATIPGSAIHDGVSVQLLYDCNNGPQEIPFNPIRLYDPSGFITDINTSQPVAGATVTLYHVPGWRAATTPADSGSDVCESNLSKPPAQAWSQPAPTALGVQLAPDLGRMSPATNQQTTGSDGYYGWDVAAGCWYVVVEAAGYQTLVSPVVGVPTEVTDLDLQLTPTAPPTAVSLNSVGASSTIPLLFVLSLGILLLTVTVERRRKS